MMALILICLCAIAATHAFFLVRFLVREKQLQKIDEELIEKLRAENARNWERQNAFQRALQKIKEKEAEEDFTS